MTSLHFMTSGVKYCLKQMAVKKREDSPVSSQPVFTLL